VLALAAVPAELTLAGPAKTAVEAPVVTVVAPGAEPRQKLRFHPPLGAKRTVLLTMRMAMDVKLGENALPKTKVPTMKLWIDTVVKSVAPNGDIRYDFAFNKAEVVDDPESAQLVQLVRDQISKVKGIKGHALVSSRGVTIETDLQLPPTLDPQMRQMLESMKQSMTQLAAPMPEEPVGLGAKWDTKMKVAQSGMRLDQTAHYTLRSLEHDRGTLGVELAQHADPQKIQAPGMPAGANVDLVSLQSGGQGEITFELVHLMPAAAKLQLNSRTKMNVEAMGQKQPMSMGIDLGFELAAQK
jgi:hypothetical protein